MHATVYLNIGKILLLPALLAAFQQPYTRLSHLFMSLLTPLLRLFFRLRYLRDRVRWQRFLLALCRHSIGLSGVMGGVK
jgi:hypothetical protein